MSKIQVTKTFLPPIEEFEAFTKQIWQNGQLTNQGPLLKQFEARVQEYLQVENFQFVANGTLALQLALKALDIMPGDEVITTPFSYVATTSAILWEQAVPIFVDIDPVTFNIDSAKIEEAISPKTKAILAVHVFGVPCDVEAIAQIAAKHNLKIIYDAAHAFGVQYRGKSLLSYGDISICSFHATKVFHTIEGGGIVTRDQALDDKIELQKRFGHNGDDHIMLGINAKANEFQAAMGLSVLPYIEQTIKERKRVYERYSRKINTSSYQMHLIDSDLNYNFAYFPIVCASSAHRQAVTKALEEHQVFPRRYFYPSLNTLPYVTGGKCPISEEITDLILCLPLYPQLQNKEVDKIVSILNATEPI